MFLLYLEEMTKFSAKSRNRVNHDVNQKIPMSHGSNGLSALVLKRFLEKCKHVATRNTLIRIYLHLVSPTF